MIRNRREIGTERGEERESSWTLESPEPRKITSGRRERQTKRKTDSQTETDGPPERNVPLQQSMNNSRRAQQPALEMATVAGRRRSGGKLDRLTGLNGLIGSGPILLFSSNCLLWQHLGFRAVAEASQWSGRTNPRDPDCAHAARDARAPRMAFPCLLTD